jgi:hypothetical protein
MAAGTESGAPEPSEAVSHAGAGALVRGGVVVNRPMGDVLHDYDWTPMEAAQTVLTAAMDPALGDDRLVVAGDERRRVIAEVVEKLRKLADLADGNKRLHERTIADFIEREFGGLS